MNLKKIAIVYFISFMWLSTLNSVELRHFYLALQLFILLLVGL